MRGDHGLTLFTVNQRPEQLDTLALSFGIVFLSVSRGENSVDTFEPHPITEGVSPTGLPLTRVHQQSCSQPGNSKDYLEHPHPRWGGQFCGLGERKTIRECLTKDADGNQGKHFDQLVARLSPHCDKGRIPSPMSSEAAGCSGRASQETTAKELESVLVARRLKNRCLSYHPHLTTPLPPSPQNQPGFFSTCFRRCQSRGPTFTDTVGL